MFMAVPCLYLWATWHAERRSEFLDVLAGGMLAVGMTTCARECCRNIEV